MQWLLREQKILVTSVFCTRIKFQLNKIYLTCKNTDSLLSAILSKKKNVNSKINWVTCPLSKAPWNFIEFKVWSSLLFLFSYLIICSQLFWFYSQLVCGIRLPCICVIDFLLFLIKLIFQMWFILLLPNYHSFDAILHYHQKLIYMSEKLSEHGVRHPYVYVILIVYVRVIFIVTKRYFL